jgi:AraC family transcriptional regulator
MSATAAVPDSVTARSDAEAGPINSGIDQWFRLRDAAKLSVRALGKSRLAVTEIRYDGYNFGMTEPVLKQDAFLLALHLKSCALEEVWYEGRAVPVYDVRAGDSALFDLKTVNVARFIEPVHSLQFFLPRSFLNELCDDLEAPRIDQLDVVPGKFTDDRVIRRLGNSVRPALAAPMEANELFASQIMLAFGIYVCATHGTLRTPRERLGGLSAWQERTAKELIDAHIDGNVALQHVAAACGLSATRFAHAFKCSVGLAPHQWLLQRRVARVKDLILHSRRSLADVALACGFADQSHMNRVFRRAVGTTPGAWKQSLQ